MNAGRIEDILIDRQELETASRISSACADGAGRRAHIEGSCENALAIPRVAKRETLVIRFLRSGCKVDVRLLFGRILLVLCMWTRLQRYQ